MPSVAEWYNLTLFDFKAILFLEIVLYFNSLLLLLHPHTSVQRRQVVEQLTAFYSICDGEHHAIHGILKKEIFLIEFKCNTVMLFLNVAV